MNIPPQVQAVIAKVFPSDDPLDQPDFDPTDYINTLFPNEQSLANVDERINKMKLEMSHNDRVIRNIVRNQSIYAQEGRDALKQAQISMKNLFAQMREIKSMAEQSEETVKEITRDIKQLDFAKKNLTQSITCLNHLHMLVERVETLKDLTRKKQYGEVIPPLEATMEVLKYFDDFMDIPQVKELADQVQQIHLELAKQITADFKEAFSGQNLTHFPKLAKGCQVLSFLDPKVKKDLLSWFKHLLDFEEKFGSIFPLEWEVSERIAVQFCHKTREDLSKLMHKRTSEIDVKLLLYAIQKTANFENLLAKRFTGITLEDSKRQDKKFEQVASAGAAATATVTSVLSDNVPGNPFEESSSRVDSDKPVTSPFANLIGRCFESYLYIYIESLDRNLAELIEKFVADCKAHPPGAQAHDGAEGPSSVLSSCADLFVFYKKCMIQCTQLSSGAIMVSLAETFQKYLREYAMKILQNNLPKIGGASIGSSVSSITRDFRDLSTSGLIQNFQSFLKEGEVSRYSKEELLRICCILTTAEYCLETTQQLEEKLKLKTDIIYADKINLSQEQDIFHGVISNCIQLLAQDLEVACEPALNAMIKLQWSSLETVGDQSMYVSTIINVLRQSIPPLRDLLSSCRKYFTQLCIKFASSFIPKLTQQIFKCKPLGAVGAEQLLLDVHMLKTALFDLPSFGCQVQRKAPANYTKVVTKGMTSAEMILKIVMTPSDLPGSFVDQCRKLIPDLKLAEYQKILDMKGLRKTEQTQLMDEFKQRVTAELTSEYKSSIAVESPEHETGRIKKLEKLIKRM
ncbi:hypothetical protein QAD02_009295 [Eretmocerus hayati]|uniref:Uncharacterized protein n=1 Tax=Eretmocerus hayati TaxID=131215 RepID=A0ACC2NB99_9HYME|nr:hypothetical protein QAD02_009295 [Eretmocerus hayati]